MMNSEIILASASPRRAELLRKESIPFIVSVEDVHEKTLNSPSETVLYNAKLKAESASQKFPDKIILAADTIVYFKNQILGKPVDSNDAFTMIEAMCGKSHIVYTGVYILNSQNLLKQWVAKSEVTFKKLSQNEIKDYLSLYNPLDKAGAYNIQEYANKIVKNLKGLKSTVAGLPVEDVCKILNEL